MVTLEQIRQLDARVHRAVELIGKLREENHTLKSRLSEYQGRIEELEVLISNFKEDQNEIEHGITSALSQLAAIDDSEKQPTAAREQRSAEPHAANGDAPSRDTAEAVTDEEDQDAELDIF